MLAVLRQRNFALVWLAGLVSLTGDWLLSVAIPVVVFEHTGSTVATALAVMVRVLPRLAVGSVAGLFVDRWDRRQTLIVANLLLGACLLPLLLIRSADWLWLLYVVSFVQSTLAQFVSPAENALLPRLVVEADLVPANALNGLNNNLARLIGPPLGGLVVAGWGLSGAALLNAGSFLIAAGLIGLVAVDGRAVRTVASVAEGARAWAAIWHDWAAGLRQVRRARPVAILFGFIAISGVGEGVMASLFAPFVAKVLDGGGLAYGSIVGAQAVGGLIGHGVIGRFGRGVSPGRLLGLGALGLGAIDLATFNAHRVIPGLGPPLLLMVIVGLPVAGMAVAQALIIQRSVADEYRGRVFGSLNAVAALSVLVGAGLAGALGDRLGIVAVLTIQGVAYLLAGVLVLALLAPGPSRPMLATGSTTGTGKDTDTDTDVDVDVDVEDERQPRDADRNGA